MLSFDSCYFLSFNDLQSRSSHSMSKKARAIKAIEKSMVSLQREVPKTVQCKLGSLVFIFLLVFGFSVLGQGSKSLRIGLIHPEAQSMYSAYVQKHFSEATCPKCQVVNLTSYNSLGEFDAQALSESLTKSDSTADLQLVFVNWNEPLTKGNLGLVEGMNSLVKKGIVVVGVAGRAREGSPSLPLTSTVLGKVDYALILGERDRRDTLPKQAFHGPLMLTALREPAEEFVTRLAKNWVSRSPQDWHQHLHSRKSRVKRPWLDVRDFF